jgi:hypothetical protein
VIKSDFAPSAATRDYPACYHPQAQHQRDLHPPHVMAYALSNGDASHAPIEVAFPLPRAPHTNVHLQLTDNGPNLLLFLTTSTAESSSSSALGSFVYAMPNVSYLPLRTCKALLTNICRELHQTIH